MSFNPDPLKPAEKIVFSFKSTNVVHPPLFFNGSQVKQVTSHKHLGLILVPNLSFAQHNNEKILKARKWIDIIKHLNLLHTNYNLRNYSLSITKLPNEYS